MTEAMRIREQGSGRAVNRSKIGALAGVKKAARAMQENGLGAFEAERIARAAWEDRYYITLSAFTWRSGATRSVCSFGGERF